MYVDSIETTTEELIKKVNTAIENIGADFKEITVETNDPVTKAEIKIMYKDGRNIYLFIDHTTRKEIDYLKNKIRN